MTRWSAYMARFDYNICYIPGKENVVADSLSRQPILATIIYSNWDEQIWVKLSTGTWPPHTPEHIKKRVTQFRVDHELNIMYKQAPNTTTSTNDLLWVPPILRGDLLARRHDLLGHQGSQGLLTHLRKDLWWPNMKTDVIHAVRTCPHCQLNQPLKDTTAHAPLHPIPVSPLFARWHLDFVGRLPKTKTGNRWILVAVESTTRWPIARATPDATAQTVAKFLYTEIYTNYGSPQEIFTDRGSNFLADVVEAYLQLVGTKHKYTSAFHPRTNSVVERYNGTLGKILTKYVMGAVRRWDHFLPQALFATRIRIHRTTKYSPFKLLYGVEPRLPTTTAPPIVFPPEELDLRAEQRAAALEAKHQLIDAANVRTQGAQQLAKYRYDKEVKRDPLRVNDWVLIKHRQRQKFQPMLYGPYRVRAVQLFDTYRLVDPQNNELFSLVHRDRLLRANVEDTPKLWYKPSVHYKKVLDGESELSDTED
ncbi:MAG: DDE-type integrase/transposase/recombinase, partial [Cyanobacteria bacterium J06553_1]